MGILANSASSTQTSSGADASVSGYVVNERIVLTTNPTGTDYVWALGGPANTTVARSALSAETGASVTFTPDVSGYWVATCTVDSTTTYVLRISVENTAISQLVEAVRFSPKSDSSVPTPAVGQTMYFSSDQDALVVKDSAGDIFPVELGAAV
jgi:hypothetical protein